MGDLYDYTASADLAVTPGSIVRVPFGREELTGVVWAVGASGDWPPDKIKPMVGVWPLPPLSAALRQMVDFTAQYTMQPRGPNRPQGQPPRTGPE
jgi:primosomal protein N' (replication factor Y) (superfamily II helicase)